jgi:hypothetical protein
MLSTYSACAENHWEYAEHARKIIESMLSMRLNHEENAKHALKRTKLMLIMRLIQFSSKIHQKERQRSKTINFFFQFLRISETKFSCLGHFKSFSFMYNYYDFITKIVQYTSVVIHKWLTFILKCHSAIKVSLEQSLENGWCWTSRTLT